MAIVHPQFIKFKVKECFGDQRWNMFEDRWNCCVGNAFEFSPKKLPPFLTRNLNWNTHNKDEKNCEILPIFPRNFGSQSSPKRHIVEKY